MIKSGFKILDERRDISGREHRLVERNDGFRFYLDPAFLWALEHARDDDLNEKLRKMGVKEHEIPVVQDLLTKAGLLPDRITK